MTTERATREGLIQAKLTAPSLPFGLVSRPRLSDRLDARPARFILIAAPAGFGKTALIVDWLTRRRLPTAWLSIDRFDNDPTRFFNHLSAALATLPHEQAARAAALVSTLGQHSGPAPELIDALAALGDGVLVLDDVHELEDDRVLRGIEQLLSVHGTGLRVVLLTRVDPPFALGRLRVNGDLLEIRERDLRFTGEECGALFTKILPGLAPSLVAELERRTEGWAAGLRMAAIALQDADDPAAAVASFAGSHRIVVDYLVEEAVEQQSEAVQRFLLDTSILDRFTVETCQAVTGDAEAAARLSAIEAANLFLVPLGHDGWYRYHHLFGELLEFRLHRRDPHRAEVLHLRASEWFEQTGDVHAALEHASRMEDRTRLLELLDAYGLDIIARSELATFERWVRRAPAPLSHPYPMLHVEIGWLRLLTERAPDLEPVLHAAELALTQMGSDYPVARTCKAQVQLSVLRSFAARFGGRLEEALELSRAVLAQLPDEDPLTRGLVVYNMARLHMLLGEMEPAAQLLTQSFDDNLRAGTLYLVLTGLGQAATVRAQLDGVYRARDELNAAAVFAEQRHLTNLPAFSAVLYHLANVDYIADRLDHAHAAGERAVELGRTGNFPEGHANGLVVLARIATARRRFGDAEALLTELAALAHNSNVVLLDTTTDVEQMRLALAREQCGAGPPVAAVELPADTERWTTVREAESMLWLRHALRTHDHGKAASLADVLRCEGEARGRGIALTVALLAAALLPDCADRWEVLDRALRLAATRGYIRPLLDYGEQLRTVLQAGLGHGLSPEARVHARLLLDRLDHGNTREAAVAPAPALVEPLTGREEEVLRYLCEDLSNKAIARTMFVSPETVKTHVKHVYWKLGASSRREAVARARELGLASMIEV